MAQVMSGLPVVEDLIAVLYRSICSGESVGEKAEIEGGLRINECLIWRFTSLSVQVVSKKKLVLGMRFGKPICSIGHVLGRPVVRSPVFPFRGRRHGSFYAWTTLEQLTTRWD